MTADAIGFKPVLLLKLEQANLGLLTILPVRAVPSAVEAPADQSGLHQLDPHGLVTILDDRERERHATSFLLRRFGSGWINRLFLVAAALKDAPIRSAKAVDVAVVHGIGVFSHRIRRIALNASHHAACHADHNTCVVDPTAHIEEHLVTNCGSGEVRAVVAVIVGRCGAERGKAALRLIGQLACEVNAEALDKSAINKDVAPRLILRVPPTRFCPLRGVLIPVVRTLGVPDLLTSRKSATAKTEKAAVKVSCTDLCV